MSPKRIQLFLILGVCAITLHFAIMLGIESVEYFSLNQQARAKITQWEILNVKNRFAIKAEYEFTAKEKNYRGAQTLKPPYFLNEMAALNALKDAAKQTWDVWYKPSNPNHSIIEKGFPYGYLFRTLTCLGVLIYFFYLTKRVVQV